MPLVTDLADQHGLSRHRGKLEERLQRRRAPVSREVGLAGGAIPGPL